MSVVKVIELVGSSAKSWEDATQEAIRKAGESVRNVKGIRVKNLTGQGRQREDNGVQGQRESGFHRRLETEARRA